MRFRIVIRRMCAVFGLLLAALTLWEPAYGASSSPRVRMGYPQPSGAMLPIWVMTEAGLDRKYGFELQNIFISGGARLTQTLVSGDVDVGSSGGAVVNAILSGAELVCIAASIPTYAFSLYTRPEIKDLASLKGKVLGVMTKGASSIMPRSRCSSAIICNRAMT